MEDIRPILTVQLQVKVGVNYSNSIPNIRNVRVSRFIEGKSIPSTTTGESRTVFSFHLSYVCTVQLLTTIKCTTNCSGVHLDRSDRPCSVRVDNTSYDVPLPSTYTVPYLPFCPGIIHFDLCPEMTTPLLGFV